MKVALATTPLFFARRFWPTITDAHKVLLAVVGTTPLTAADQIRYDVAPLSTSGTPVGNGSIDAADVILILRRSIGIGGW